ncbi:olfactory receptor 10A3-like [Melanotaenia boesemani]|uniref:olfactory receptor 10A3-like n=1 Tax=Melanotaenia boesemani TaxID=1250792 RepID=UPI001C050B9B|nr:olfactory receptor 10A3-like [Melanotaenia boesemani]
MKNNSSFNSYFHLALFSDFGPVRYVFFSLCLLIYTIINCANVVIILTVCLNKYLHQPMYVFICCLSFNSLYGSAGFFPKFLFDMVSDTHYVSRSTCFIQIFVLYMYAICEMTILSIMAYDRFVAICQPLHYHSKMTFKMVLRLIIFAELYPAFICGACLSLTIRLPLCGNKLNRLFCTNWPVVQLSCVDTTVNNITGLIATVTAIFLPLLFVLYTYLRILLVSRRSSSDFRGKALQTCLPHMVTFVNYSLSFFGELLLNRLKDYEINPFVIVVLSLEFLIIPPIINPLVYGLKLPQIKGVIFGFLRLMKNTQM